MNKPGHDMPPCPSAVVAYISPQGVLQTVNYERSELVKALNDGKGLTFDGSSIPGLTSQGESDLVILPDWDSAVFLPGSLVLPSTKTIMFGNIQRTDGSMYPADTRGLLSNFSANLAAQNRQFVVATEIECFALEKPDAEINFIGGHNRKDFTPSDPSSGYYKVDFTAKFGQFLELYARVLRAVGFKLEKFHGEVAPGQLEINFTYSPALQMADLVMLYKLIGCQLARCFGLTLTFLPKPFSDLNGSGMHTHFNTTKDGKNEYAGSGQFGLSNFGLTALSRVMSVIHDISPIIASSVNAIRRLNAGARFESPNKLYISPKDRGGRN